jgi:phage replication O-like protein O
MASPQTENGYTKFANELMEALARNRIPGQELRVVLAVARKTYGYGKKQDAISYGQIAQMTDIPRTRVIKHVQSLVSKMVLGSLNNGTRKPPTLWINKDYETWKPSPKKGTSPKEGTIASPIVGNRSSPNNGTHKRKKENLQKKEGDFEIFWKACQWPNKGSKKQAREQWGKTAKERPSLPDLLKIIELQIKDKREKKSQGEFVPEFQHVVRWLKNARWEDELEVNTEPTKIYCPGCGQRHTPEAVKREGGKCPACARQLTEGKA